jgi:microcystin-dependent protein
MAWQTQNAKGRSRLPPWVLIAAGVILLLYLVSIESRLAKSRNPATFEQLKQSLERLDALSTEVTGLQGRVGELEGKMLGGLPGGPQELARLKSGRVPVGTVVAFAGDARSGVPKGWLLCDGAEVSRDQYPELFAAIGTIYSAGDRATTFHLPDYRGLFLRGVDDPDGRAGKDAAGRDPDAAARRQMLTGEEVGGGVGTVQGDATRAPNNPFVTEADGAHEHVVLWSRDGGGGLPGVRHAFESSPNRYGKTTVPRQDDERQPEADGVHIHGIDPKTGDKETRPKNASVNWIIKAVAE